MKKSQLLYFSWILLATVLASCSAKKPPLFEKLNSARTGIQFINHNADTDSLNILDYLYYYNGGGVAAGDINNDGLTDLYFISNQGANALYLNKGGFSFEDITEKAGVKGSADWSTGVTMVDINADGYLDIYVSTVTGHRPEGSQKVFFPIGHNELYINNRNGSFTERSAEYGLDLKGYNTQAVFFDYDHDGDLDMFQLQHSIHRTDTYGDTSARRKFSSVSGGKIFRNDGQKFTDVTVSSGIFSSVLGYGLGVIAADFNNDGWDDLYIGNDFHENDYYYINQKNGSFREMNSTAFGHQSNFSMGNDAADINHDGWLDLFTLDMLPADEKVLKSSMGDESFDTYMNQRSLGYGYQYSRNCLQINTGHGERFSEQGLISGVAATDWSWSALFNDYNLDGQTDLFVTNGIRRRLNDMDYIKFLSSGSSNEPQQDKELLQRQPAGSWHNYIFQGTDSLQFIDRSVDWGFEAAGLSQGAVYADLDNDGDADLVTNNMNEEAGIYENRSRQQEKPDNYCKVRFKGSAPNTQGIGARVFLFCKGLLQYQQLQPARGFLSSVEPTLFFGLGKASTIDSLFIQWPNGAVEKKYRIAGNQLITINQSEARDSIDISYLYNKPSRGHFRDITAETGIRFRHKENLSFNDFSRQLLIPHELSTAGPAVAVGDINGDGLEDIYFGGAKRQPGEMYVQEKNGIFRQVPEPDIAADSASEDVDAIFFDADGDKDQDLYVVSGGNEYFGNMPPLADRLYLNDGAGQYKRSEGLPPLYENKSVVQACDIDRDGDIDLFVGGRANSQAYGEIPRSFLLTNDGKGKFHVVTTEAAPGLEKAGMITGAAFTDVDGNGWPDLLLAGEWMSPVLFANTGGHFKKTSLPGLHDLSGLWSALQLFDVNSDGNLDIVLGNYGLNSKLQATAEHPLKLYVADVDNNHTTDQLMAVYKEGNYFPFYNKELLDKQLPVLKKNYLSYSKMAGVPFGDVFNNLPENTQILEASTLSSMVLLRSGSSYIPRVLPREVQLAPVFSFYVGDLDGDRVNDLIAGGNFYGVTPYEGRYDGLLATPLFGAGKGDFNKQAYDPIFSKVGGEVRKIVPINISGTHCLLIARNNGTPVVIAY